MQINTKIKTFDSYHSEMSTVNTLGYLVSCADGGYLCVLFKRKAKSWFILPTLRRKVVVCNG